jgi:hypothetical protein
VLDRHTNEFAVLFHVDRGGLAGGADHDDTVGTFLDVKVDEAAEAGQIQAAIFLHRRDDGDNRTGNHGLSGMDGKITIVPNHFPKASRAQMTVTKSPAGAGHRGEKTAEKPTDRPGS